jgi:hypothetical protein
MVFVMVISGNTEDKFKTTLIISVKSKWKKEVRKLDIEPSNVSVKLRSV